MQNLKKKRNRPQHCQMQHLHRPDLHLHTRGDGQEHSLFGTTHHF